MNGGIKFIINSVLSMVVIILSYIIPKKERLWVFSTADGINFKDNPKYLYLYILNNVPEYKVYWATASKHLYNELKEKRLPVTYIYTFKHLIKLLRAEIIVNDDTENPALYNSLFSFLGRFNLLLTWHGTGFKNIGLMDDKYNRENYRFKKILFYMRKKLYQKYFFIIATSDKDKERKEVCFQNNNVYVTGAPRNDIFFNVKRTKDYKKKFNIDKYNTIIVYAPTFRETNTFIPFSEEFYLKLQQYLQQTNSIFVVKKHKYDRALNVPCIYDNIIDLTPKVGDVQELLAVADILISDYSGIVSDFVLTERPILFYVYDYDDYVKNCRTFTYDLKKLLPGPFIYNEDVLLQYICDIKWFDDKLYKNRYLKFKELFQKYDDDKSSFRVLALLENMQKR